MSYPNPAKNFFNIEIKEELENILNTKIYDVKGSEIKLKELTIESLNKETTKIKLKINDFKTGIYFIKIELKNNKIIIDKFKKID